MLAGGKAAVVHRQLLEQLDIGGQADARVSAFDQVVAEQRFGRKPVAQHLVKRADIVNRLAVENRFQKQILLRVGDGPGVRIGAAWYRRKCA